MCASNPRKSTSWHTALRLRKKSEKKDKDGKREGKLENGYRKSREGLSNKVSVKVSSAALGWQGAGSLGTPACARGRPPGLRRGLAGAVLVQGRHLRDPAHSGLAENAGGLSGEAGTRCPEADWVQTRHGPDFLGRLPQAAGGVTGGRDAGPRAAGGRAPLRSGCLKPGGPGGCAWSKGNSLQKGTRGLGQDSGRRDGTRDRAPVFGQRFVWVGSRRLSQARGTGGSWGVARGESGVSCE